LDAYVKQCITFLRKKGIAITRHWVPKTLTIIIVVTLCLSSLVIFLQWRELVSAKSEMETTIKVVDDFTKVVVNYIDLKNKEATASYNLSEAIGLRLQDAEAKLIEPEKRLFTVTAYSASDSIQGTTTKSAMGDNIFEYPFKICAVDPNVIPLGSIVIVIMPDGKEEVFVARDTGGAIQGEHIDILMGSKEAAQTFGTQTLQIRWFVPKL